MQKISKKHYWIRQIRRPMCLALIVLIVFCHGFVSNAENINFKDYYNIDGDSLSILSFDGMKSYYNSFEYDSSKLFDLRTKYNIMSNGQSYLNTYLVNNSNFYLFNSVENNGFTLDYSDCYTVIEAFSDGNPNNVYVYRFNGSGTFKMVNGFVISDSPFIYSTGSWYNNGYTFYSSGKNINISQASGNGFYCCPVNFGQVVFTDLDINISSSDGSSGFTNYSANSTDYVINNENFNFNYVKENGFIVSPADPIIEPELNIIGQYYTYANVSGSFAPSSNTSLGAHLSINANEYMRTHPEEYKVNLDYYVIPFITDGNHYFQCHHEYDLSSLIGGGHYQIPDGSFSDSVDFNHLIWRTEQTTLAQHIIENYRSKYPNSANNMSVSDVFRNIFNWDITSSSSGKEINGVVLGNWTMNPLLSNWFASMQAGLTVTITWIGGNPEYTSGEITFTYKTGEGTKVTKNTISNNFNPPEVYDPQYPAQITDGNGNTIVNGTPVNTYLYNNLQATIEHLFNIDASDINNIGGNMHNMYQGLVTELSNTSQSGFWGVLKQTYTFIPEEIWNWIKIVVGFLLGGTVVGWAYNGWRIKGK